MIDTIDNITFCEIEKFAKGLQGCFTKHRKHSSNEITKIEMDFANKIIDLHLELVRLRWEQGCQEMAEAHNE